MKNFVPSRPLLAAMGLCVALTNAPAFAATVPIPHNALLSEQSATTYAVEREAKNKLNKQQYKDVRVTVDAGGVTTLSGTVPLFQHKQEAAQRVRKSLGVTAVNNQIVVAGATVSDKDLAKKLGKQLTYDRVGYWNVFNAITMKVDNGVVSLGGHARTPWDKDSALRLAAACPGVKNVVDNIQVDPLSGFDDRTRMDLLRAIYGSDTLGKYALDPAKPIRISVQNGVVTLYGTVESAMDKQIAYMRARSVPNVFEVNDRLEVASASKN